MGDLVIAGLKKWFQRDRVIIENVTVDLSSPSIVSIVGPNAVGKSTFLRLLAGLLMPDSGTIMFNGSSLAHVRLGYVPQGNPIFPWRTVEDDIALPLEIQGLSRRERRDMVRELLARFSINLPLQAMTATLSGGQRQFVSLCRALIGAPPPEMILLDEPFSALDANAQRELFVHLQSVVADRKCLIILSTHQLDLAVLSSTCILPFSSSPVRCINTDKIDIALGHPRLLQLRTDPRFQNALANLERTLFPVGATGFD